MKNLKEKKGISLIVLVLTIIIMIILATAIILSLSNSGIIGKASKAKEDSDYATLNEAANLAYTNWYLDKSSGETEDLATYLSSTLKAQGFTDEDIKKVEILDNGINVLKYLAVIPEGFVASQATGETKVSTGLVIYEGSTPVTDANVAEARTTRNQFVWVPVDDIDEFLNITMSSDTTGDDLIDSYGNSIDLTEGSFPTYVNEFTAMVTSVKKYHGFYIARYESSKNSEGNAQSVSSSSPWIGDLNTGIGSMAALTGYDGAAVTKSRSLYPNSSDKGVVSTLVYNEQWDAAVRFIEKNYPGITKDSTKYGNHNGTSVVNTGSDIKYAQNNIYDMCGNLLECTMTKDLDVTFLAYYRGSCYIADYSKLSGYSSSSWKFGTISSFYDGYGDTCVVNCINLSSGTPDQSEFLTSVVRL